MERNFADSKQLHEHRYARLRGLDKVKQQCLLSAACQNMKKIATHKARKALFALIGWLTALVRPRQWRDDDRSQTHGQKLLDRILHQLACKIAQGFDWLKDFPTERNNGVYFRKRKILQAIKD